MKMFSTLLLTFFLLSSSIGASVNASVPHLDVTMKMASKENSSVSANHDCHMNDDNNKNTSLLNESSEHPECCQNEGHLTDFAGCGKCEECSADLSISFLAILLGSNLVVFTPEHNKITFSFKLPNPPFESLSIPPIS